MIHDDAHRFKNACAQIRLTTREIGGARRANNDVLADLEFVGERRVLALLRVEQLFERIVVRSRLQRFKLLLLLLLLLCDFVKVIAIAVLVLKNRTQNKRHRTITFEIICFSRSLAFENFASFAALHTQQIPNQTTDQHRSINQGNRTSNIDVVIDQQRIELTRFRCLVSRRSARRRAAPAHARHDGLWDWMMLIMMMLLLLEMMMTVVVVVERHKNNSISTMIRFYLEHRNTINILLAFFEKKNERESNYEEKIKNTTSAHKDKTKKTGQNFEQNNNKKATRRRDLATTDCSYCATASAAELTAYKNKNKK